MKKFSFSQLMLYLLLIACTILSIFPLYWMFVIGSRSTHAVYEYPPVMIPGDRFFLNFTRALENIDFWRSMWNSAFVSGVVMISVLFLCSLAGFAFAKFRFPLKGPLFICILVTLVVPTQLNIVPAYIIINKLNLLDSLWALILPNMVTAFGIFWMRQYIQAAVHDELLESGTIDGCGNFRLYWNIAVPVILPAFAMLGIVTFLGIWNDFMWPLIVLKTSDNFTVQVMLRTLYSNLQQRDYAKILSATFVATVPLIVIFIFMRRYFIGGLTAGAIKS